MHKEKVLILGGGVDGIYASKVMLLKNLFVYLYDDNKLYDAIELKKEIPVNVDFKLILGEIDDRIVRECKLCIITSAFYRKHYLLENIKNYNIPIMSEMELGFEISKGNMCAITGSNGKTTVLKMLNKILNKHYMDVFEIENSINPFTKIYSATNEKSCQVVKCEGNQLEYIYKFKPNVACILNLSKNDLLEYDSYEEYVNSKINVACNMTKSDYLILNYEDSLLRDLAKKTSLFNCRIVFFSKKRILPEGVYLYDDYIYIKSNSGLLKLLSVKELQLIGEHNYDNIMAAIAVSHYMGVGIKDIVDEIKNFKPIEHRIEFVREKGGVKFYNDSKSSDPEACIRAINAMQGRTILIAGGKNNNMDIGELASVIKEKIKYLILIGESKKVISSKIRTINYNNIIYAENINNAVDIANSYANTGDNVLLSPGFPCSDMYNNYEERGNAFKNKVLSLR